MSTIISKLGNDTNNIVIDVETEYKLSFVYNERNKNEMEFHIKHFINSIEISSIWGTVLIDTGFIEPFGIYYSDLSDFADTVVTPYGTWEFYDSTKNYNRRLRDIEDIGFHISNKAWRVYCGKTEVLNFKLNDSQKTQFTNEIKEFTQKISTLYDEEQKTIQQ